MGIERIKKVSLAKNYTKEDINLSEYLFSKAIKNLKDVEVSGESIFFYQAIELFEKSIITYPKQSKSYIALSFLFWKMNEHENAITLLKKAREFDSFDLNISKQMKLINDDYIQKQKEKIVKRHSTELINKVSEPRKSTISEGINTIKSVFTKKDDTKNKTIIKKLSGNNFSFNEIAQVNNSHNSNNNISDALNQLKTQRENIKIKTSSEFLNKFKLVEI